MTGTFENASTATQFVHKSGLHLTFDVTQNASELNADGSLSEGQAVALKSDVIVKKATTGAFAIGTVTVKPRNGKITVATCFKQLLTAPLKNDETPVSGDFLTQSQAPTSLGYEYIASTAGDSADAICVKNNGDGTVLVGVLIQPIKV